MRPGLTRKYSAQTIARREFTGASHHAELHAHVHNVIACVGFSGARQHALQLYALARFQLMAAPTDLLGSAANGASGSDYDAPMTLQLLPLDVLREVLQYCSGIDLASVSVASKELRMLL